MDTNPTNDNTFKIAAYVVVIACVAVFVIRIAMYAVPLVKALSR